MSRAEYESKLQMALKRWLQTERRALLFIMTDGELNRVETENACDVAAACDDVDPSDLVSVIGEHARGAFSLSDRSDNGGAF